MWFTRYIQSGFTAVDLSYVVYDGVLTFTFVLILLIITLLHLMGTYIICKDWKDSYLHACFFALCLLQ